MTVDQAIDLIMGEVFELRFEYPDDTSETRPARVKYTKREHGIDIALNCVPDLPRSGSDKVVVVVDGVDNIKTDLRYDTQMVGDSVDLYTRVEFGPWIQN